MLHGLRRRGVRLWRDYPQLSAESVGAAEAPALVIAGAKDHSELPHAVATVEAVPSAEPAVVPGVGHAVPRDAPDVVVETIDRFLMGRWPP